MSQINRVARSINTIVQPCDSSGAIFLWTRVYSSSPSTAGVKTEGTKQKRRAFFLATESLLPAIDTVFADTIEACRGVEAHPFCQSRQDLHNDRNRCFQMRKGGELCF